jgi:hypothetical protein
MPNHLSILGIIHTVISVLAVITAIFALLRYGKINPVSGAGKLYIVLTVITCLTGLPIMKTGHPTAGHPLAIIILILLPIAVYARSIRFFGKSAVYIQTIIMSFTLFLSLIPATVETLTRLPMSQPLATDPNSPIVKTTLTVVFILFIVGVAYQVIRLRSQRKRLPAQA